MMLAILIVAGAAVPASAELGASNNPESCRPLWEAVGLPTRADDDSTGTTLVCHLGYVANHNNEARAPDWVLERITSADVTGEFNRPKVKFKEETALPDGIKGAGNDQYDGSEMDRGHQAASADFSGDETRMIDTFFYSNAVPQRGLGFNRHIWRELEELVQKLASERGDLVVITGPVNDHGVAIAAASDACRNAVELSPPSKAAICDENDGNPNAVCTQGVVVPAALFKIIYDPQLQRVNAYVMANRDHRPLRSKRKALEYLKQHRVGVGTVEELTGLRFFSALEPRAARTLREDCPATMLH